MTTVSIRRDREGIGSTGRAAARLAWSLCGLSLALAAAGLLLLVLNLSHANTLVYDPWLDNTVGALSYAPIGAFIASRRPENPVGWLLCVYGLATGLSFFCAEYAIHALLARPGTLPAGEAMVWLLSLSLPVIIGVSVLPLLLFPTGGLPNRRWRWAVWATAAFVVAGVTSAAFASDALMGILGPIRNPLGFDGFTNGFYSGLILFVSPVLLGAAALSLFARLRRAAGVERQQIKWFAYAAALSVGATGLAYIVPGVFDTPLWFERLGFILNIASIPAIPASVGIAILRYRLYEIDLLINRTLVYATLTAALAAVYFGCVATTQAVFQSLTGQDRLPQLAIVVSTLLIAALFNPLRRRIQTFIDRRFYRRKFDAAKTFQAFSAKLRDETDLDALRSALVGAVGATMQPTHASVWLRADDPSGNGE